MPLAPRVDSRRNLNLECNRLYSPRTNRDVSRENAPGLMRSIDGYRCRGNGRIIVVSLSVL